MPTKASTMDSVHDIPVKIVGIGCKDVPVVLKVFFMRTHNAPDYGLRGPTKK